MQLIIEEVDFKIYLVRGHKVMLDSDLATLYAVPTFMLNRAVRRNGDRFPSDFMFELTANEASALRCQIGISNIGRGGRRYLPLAFTEHGVAMLSSVLNSKRAIQMNIAIMRAFSRLRHFLNRHQDIAKQLHKLELRIDTQDAKILSILNALKQLIEPTHRRPKRIDFKSK